MNKTAEVYLWGTRVGIIHQDIDMPYASFEYDDKFVNSGIEISPIMMPLGKKYIDFQPLQMNLFGACRDWWQILYRIALETELSNNGLHLMVDRLVNLQRLTGSVIQAKEEWEH